MGKHSKESDSSITKYAALAVISTGSIPLIATQADAASVSTWDKVAACESSGNWAINTGNGFYGGLQFTPSTWAAYGGHAFAPNAHLASKQQQIIIAERVLEGGWGAHKPQGPVAWPACSVRAGLTADGINPYPAPAKPAPAPSAPKAEDPAPGKGAGSKVYTIKRGDWLSKIAGREYGDVHKWPRIYDANRDVIGSNPNVVVPGQRIKIPGESVTAPVQKPAQEPAPAPVKASWVKPLDARVSQAFGNPSSGYTLGYHTGTDFSASSGTRVSSPGAATVVASDTSSAYGINVQVKFADGRYGLFAHLSAKSVQVGQKVSAGQKLGLVGSTGTNSSGPHLHMEIRITPSFKAGNFLDPVKWLRGHGVSI